MGDPFASGMVAEQDSVCRAVRRQREGYRRLAVRSAKVVDAGHALCAWRKVAMEYDIDRVDEMVLALLYLTSSQDRYATRAWKGLNWEAMDRLHEKGYISDPKGKSPSVVLSETGAALSRELFFKHFGVKE